MDRPVAQGAQAREAQGPRREGVLEVVADQCCRRGGVGVSEGWRGGLGWMGGWVERAWIGGVKVGRAYLCVCRPFAFVFWPLSALLRRRVRRVGMMVLVQRRW